MYYTKSPNQIRFDTAEDFDTAREPSPGKMFLVDIDNETVNERFSNQIWHHKWLFVKDDYKGFDVMQSYEWSKKMVAKDYQSIRI